MRWFRGRMETIRAEKGLWEPTEDEAHVEYRRLLRLAQRGTQPPQEHEHEFESVVDMTTGIPYYVCECGEVER